MLPIAETIQIIVPIASILCLLLTFKRSIYGVIAYFIALNGKIGEMYPFFAEIRYELVAAAIVVISIFLKQQGLKNLLPNSNKLNTPLWILFAVGMLSIPQSIDASVSWEFGGYNLVKLIIFYSMAVASINDRQDLEIMLWAIILVTGWIAYEPVVNYLNGIVSTYGYGNVAKGRFGAAAGHVALSNTLNQAIPIAIFYAATDEKRNAKKIILYGLIGFLVLGIIFSRSRGGFIGLVIIAAGLIYFSKNRSKAVMIAIPVFAVLLVFAGGSYISHMGTIADGIHGSRSANDRFIGLLNGISMMIKRPIMGVGIGCYPEARFQYFSYYFYSHNLYGELFGELGLCSFFWFYWIYRVLKRIGEIKTNLANNTDAFKFYINILIGIQLALVLRLILGNLTHGAFFWFWFLMAALIVCIDNMTRKEQLEGEPATA